MPFALPRSRPSLVAAGAILFAAALTAAHLHVEREGPSYVGPLLLLDHLFDLGAAMAVLAVCFAAGRLALRRAGPPLDRPLEALLFGTAVGAGLVATGILVLGFAGGLRPVVLAGFLGVVAFAARRELRALPALVREAARGARGARGARAQAGSRGLGALAVVTLVLAALFLLAFALAPPVDWDSLMYHLRVPSQFLERGRIYLPEDNLRTSYINLVHMLYLPLLAVGSPSGPAALSALFALLLGVAAFSFCARFLPGAAASVSVVLLWGTTTLLLVAITPRVDVTLALFLFLAHYALVWALAEPSDRRPFFLGAALLGLAVGVKYHALPYAVALSPLAAWAAAAPARRAAAAVKPLALFGALAAAAALPWLLKNWLLLGAPIYPVLAKPLLEPWLVPLFGGRAVPETVDPAALRIVWDSRVPFNLWDAFFAPGRISIEFEGNFYFTNPALLALPAWLLFARERTLNALVLPALGYLLILLVPFPSTNLRYLAPAIAPLTIAVAYTAVRLAEGRLDRRAAHAALAALALLCLLPSARTAHRWLRDTLAVEHLVGARSAEDYMAGHLLPGARTYAPVVRWVNANVPASGRVLMLFEGRGFYFAPEVIQDHSASHWSLLATLALEDCLRSRGITHVLLGIGAARYFVAGGVDPAVLRWDRLERFAERCLERVYEGPGFVVFRVRGPQEPAPGPVEVPPLRYR